MNKIVKSNLEIQDWLNSLTEDVDLWITDPPYPFENRNGGRRFKYINGVDHMYHRFDWNDMKNVFQKFYDKTSDGGRMYVFCNRDGIFEMKPMMEAMGWDFRNLLVWEKDKIGLGFHWRHQVEYILYFSKGKLKHYVKSPNNIFKYPKPKPTDSVPSVGYTVSGQSPKPKQIWEDILKYGGKEGDVVADPFAGSDPLSAAINLNKDLFDKIKKSYSNIYLT